MKITKLALNNFRSAKNTQFEFSDQLNLFVGINGTGKSTVLDSISICLSWLIKRIEKDNGRGTQIPNSSLTVGEDNGFLDIHVTENNSAFRWVLTKTANAKSSKLDSQFEGVTRLAEIIRKQNEEQKSWPLIAYYPVNRVVSAIRPNFQDKDSAYNLDIYENALGGKTNYQSFFEWFRLQDDILNEKSASRSKWMQQNRILIKDRILNISAYVLAVSINFTKNIDMDEPLYLSKCLDKDDIIFEEPRFLFRELSHFGDMLAHQSQDNFKYEKLFHDLEYMFHRMSTLSSEFRDDLIEDGGIHDKVFDQFIRNFTNVIYEGNIDDSMMNFLWELFSFAIVLGLWWVSDKSKLNLENELKLMREKIKPSLFDNSHEVADNLVKTLQQIIKREVQYQKNVFGNEGRELQFVTKAIESFLPGYNNLRVKRVPRPHMLIDKNDETFDLEQLSDGEKNLIVLVGDIARRLALGNPGSENPLHGEGVILIDEIDLHLHPRWQRLVIPQLLATFPNCQFFISTHSPQIISNVKPEQIFLLEQHEGCLDYRKVDESFGMSLDRVVELIMDDESRPDKTKEDLENLFELIERKKLIPAKELLAELKKDMPSDPDIMRAEMLIRQEEMAK